MEPRGSSDEMPITHMAGLSGDVKVGLYDSDRRLVREVGHVDGRFVEPVTLEPGQTLWATVPTEDGRLVQVAPLRWPTVDVGTLEPFDIHPLLVAEDLYARTPRWRLLRRRKLSREIRRIMSMMSMVELQRLLNNRRARMIEAAEAIRHGLPSGP